jgi:hypothetical protein
VARSALQQRRWLCVCCVALSATGQPEATSPSVYMNWIEQKDYGATADCDCVYYGMYFWFVRVHTTGHPLHLRSICFPSQEEKHATDMSDGPSTWQSWVPVSESKYTLVGLFCSKNVCVYSFSTLLLTSLHVSAICHIQASIRKSNYNAPFLKYVHSIKSYYFNKCS